MVRRWIFGTVCRSFGSCCAFELSGLQQGFSRFSGFGCCLRVFGLGSFRALSRAQGFGICLGLRVEKLVIQGFRL